MKTKRVFSAEHRRKLSEAKKGQHPSTEFKTGNTLWVGRHHTESTKKKLSEALKGKRLPAEVRSAMSRGHMASFLGIRD